MFNVIGGSLFQWDIDRKLEILDRNIVKLAFANDIHCDCEKVDVVDGFVTIPNKYLQSSQALEIYGVDSEGNEVNACKLYVNPKLKPSDYNIPIDGGGSAACDWNTMQNKPFGEEIGENDIFPAQEIDFDSTSVSIGEYEVIEGQEYWLEVDGEKIKGVGEQIGKPFYSMGIKFENGAYTGFGELMGMEQYSGVKTVRIYTVENIVTPLESKFIPNEKFVSYETSQKLTDEQKATAIKNLGIGRFYRTSLINLGATNDTSSKITESGLTVSDFNNKMVHGLLDINFRIVVGVNKVASPCQIMSVNVLEEGQIADLIFEIDEEIKHLYITVVANTDDQTIKFYKKTADTNAEVYVENIDCICTGNYINQ